MRTLMILVLAGLPALAAASPTPRLTLPVTPWTEDLAHWTPRRVDEAMRLADHYLDRCGIDVEASPVRALPPGDVTQDARLWRTDRPEELVVVMRAEGDARAYPLADVASLRKRGGRWIGEVAWKPLVLAVAQTVAQGKLPSWPAFEPRQGAEAMAQARLAMAWAAAKGWITFEPAVAEAHCAFLRGRLVKMTEAPAAPPRVDAAAFRRRRYALMQSEAAPAALLVADVPRRDAFAFAVRVGDAWQMSTLKDGGFTPHRGTLPAHGEGLALIQVGGARLLVSRRPDGAIHAAWWHPDARRRGEFRPDRVLEGCAEVQAADVMRPSERKGHGDADPGVALVVCRDRVFQLAPLRLYPERVDPLPPARWSTLTRWGPGRVHLLRGDAKALRGHDLLQAAAPAPLTPPAAARALHRARPDAPIWNALGAPPVQLAPDAVHGLPSGTRPLGEGAIARLQPQLYRVARLRPDGDGWEARVDALYADRPHRGRLPAGGQWATHQGDYGPLLWLLVRDGERWSAEALGWEEVQRAARERRRATRLERVRQTLGAPPGTAPPPPPVAKPSPRPAP